MASKVELMLDMKAYSFEEMLDEKGFLAYTSVGVSMMPLLRQRKDIIIIYRKPADRCRKYDVVLYKRGDNYILHRILRVTPMGYVIAGDHNTIKEYDVTDDMILGVMSCIIRDGKYIYTNDWYYKLYYHIWVDFFPIRVCILRLKSKMCRILGILSK